MNKKQKKIVLGICIPYYKNSDECEIAFKKLMEQIDNQLTDDMVLYVYEDGQFSNWLWQYAQKKPNLIKVKSNAKNKGVSFARNYILDHLINEVDYILFLDSDDRIADNYLKVMCDNCADNTHEIIESYFENGRFKTEFNKNAVRSGAAGSALQSKIIGKIRFDERLQIGEDTKFMNEVCDLSKYRKKLAKTNYYYQLGINPNSLTMKYDKKEIKKVRN